MVTSNYLLPPFGFGFGFGVSGNGFGFGKHGPLLPGLLMIDLKGPWVLHLTGGMIGSGPHFTGGMVSKGPKKYGPPWVPSGSSGPPGQVGQHGNTSCWVFKWGIQN